MGDLISPSISMVKLSQPSLHHLAARVEGLRALLTRKLIESSIRTITVS